MRVSYSIEEVCLATGLGRTKIYEAINRGELRAKKHGKRTLVLKTDLDVFVSGMEPYQAHVEGHHG